ncbi:MAG: preprotein translocase subunit SecA [bacterium]|nr:preprotein translocase subunit SecA [bacterium]
MPFGFFKKFFGTQMEREQKRIEPIVAQINEICDSYGSLPEDGLPTKTEEFRQRLAAGETTDDLLPEAFALVKEACRRMMGREHELLGSQVEWGMIPFDVQLFGGIILNSGQIAEMATGEGKTLVATLPLYLNALAGKGAHLVTVNDYLAERDAEWMRPIFESLGLTVGVLLPRMTPENRQRAYRCDITYGTNSEFGFDYLRDNMVGSADQQVQRGFHFAIVDEVDSILVDEARTPLIISGPVRGSSSDEKFREHRPMVESLFRKQQTLVNRMVAEVEKLAKQQAQEADDDRRWQMGTMLLQLRHGAPKNKRFMRLMQEEGMASLVTQVENANIRDKTMHELDSVLYFGIDEKGHSIELMEMGLDSLSEKDRGVFVLPDISEKVGQIDADPDLDSKQKAIAREEAHREYAERSELIHMVQQLLRAYSLYEKDIEYVVQEGKVQIVDEFTGRVLHGRRYSDGLHQAIEAKEGVRIEGQTQTYATITYQNFFRMYEKLTGMTGTAITEETEFWEIYKLKVMVIPTNQPIARDDMEDRIYRTRKEKVEAILNEVRRLHDIGLPVLVGTVSVEFSEMLSRLLKGRNVPHSVLNAKQHQSEAQIVANAGQPGAVTIATNMAGRGTDIKLHPGVVDGSGLKIELEELPEDITLGLQILGTERHESRRIDRQLRGRAGRQGDPGRSLFFLSLEDNLMRLFSGDRMGQVMDRIGVQEGEVIAHRLVTQAIERAQKRVEAYNFDIRKNLIKYDDVMNAQREVVYDRREFYLKNEDISEELEDKSYNVVNELLDKHIPERTHTEDWETDGLFLELEAIFLGDLSLPGEDLELLDRDQFRNHLIERATGRLNDRRNALPGDIFAQVARFALLRSLDEAWKDHLLELDNLKSGIGLRAYAQKDPLIEFKSEGFALFEEFISRVDRDSLYTLFHLEVRTAPETYEGEDLSQVKTEHDSADSYKDAAQKQRAQAAQNPQAGGRAPSAADAISADGRPQGKPQPVVHDAPKVGRNDPCSCGSGRKYKKCCGRQGS